MFPMLHQMNLVYYDAKMKSKTRGSRDVEPSWSIGQVQGSSNMSLESSSPEVMPSWTHTDAESPVLQFLGGQQR